MAGENLRLACNQCTKKRKDYTYWRHFNVKPGNIPGCLNNQCICVSHCSCEALLLFEPGMDHSADAELASCMEVVSQSFLLSKTITSPPDMYGVLGLSYTAC